MTFYYLYGADQIGNQAISSRTIRQLALSEYSCSNMSIKFVSKEWKFNIPKGPVMGIVVQHTKGVAGM